MDVGGPGFCLREVRRVEVASGKIPSDPVEREEDRWWSPGPPEPSSEEDEEEVRYLTEVFKLGPKGGEAEREEPSAPAEATPCAKAGGQICQAPNRTGGRQRRLRRRSCPAQRRPGEGSSGRR
jgi:hypothetical protein